MDGTGIGNWALEIRDIKKVLDLGNSISKILKIIFYSIRVILYFEKKKCILKIKKHIFFLNNIFLYFENIFLYFIYFFFFRSFFLAEGLFWMTVLLGSLQAAPFLYRRLRMCMKGWAKSKPQLLRGGLGDG